MRIYWEKLLPTLFAWVISLLAGRYLGGAYLFFFRGFTVLLFLDTLLFFLGWLGLRYNQHFSSEHISRGERIRYDFYIQQSLPLASRRVRVNFHPLKMVENLYPDQLEIQLKKQERESREYSILAHNRGIYETGLKQVTLFDQLGLWEIPLILYPRTFYVYPRIYNRDRRAPRAFSQEGDREALEREGQDQTFRSLKEYRTGMDMRGISWKHFARLDRPVIREQGISSSSNRIILLDRRPLPRDREDLLLENTLAFINSCRDNREPVRLAGFIPGSILTLVGEEDWQSLIKGCLSLPFDSPSLLDVNLPEGAPVTVVSALQDSRILEGGFWMNRDNWQLMALLEGLDQKEKNRRRNRLEELKKLGVQQILIEKGESFWSAG